MVRSGNGHHSREETAMMITRANFLRGLVATTALPLTARAAPQEVAALGQFQADGLEGGVMPFSARPATGAAPLRFAVIGDNTGIARPGVFDAAMTQIGWLKPDFILSVGDLIEGYSDDKAAIGKQWEAVERSIAKAGVPFIHTPGNHDVDNAVTLDV